MKNLIILGAGGHGRVVAEAAELDERWSKISFLDDRDDIERINNFEVVGKLNDFANLVEKYDYAFVAIGNNEKRVDLINRLIITGFIVPVITHPGAYVSKYSKLGMGSVILPGAVVNTNSNIGKGCIVNINSCVDHDCDIGDGVHISSGAVIRSMSKIGMFSFIGAGACVRAGSSLDVKSILDDGEIF